MHVTANGTTHLHQLVSRGHNKSLEAVLQAMAYRDDIGPAKVAHLLNHRAGRYQLGCVDTALKCNKAVVAMLKYFGGQEQTQAPPDWEKTGGGIRAMAPTTPGPTRREDEHRDARPLALSASGLVEALSPPGFRDFSKSLFARYARPAF